MKFKIEQLESYTVMPNTHLRDKKISLKAKGLLSIMYALPNDWDYTMNGLAKITNTGITALRNTISELEINGYLTRKQERDQKGKIDYNWIVHIKPKKRSIKNSTKCRRMLSAYGIKV